MIKNILAGIGILAMVIFVALLIGVFVVLPGMLKSVPSNLKPDLNYSTQGALVTVTVSEGDINAKLAENPQIAEGVGSALGPLPMFGQTTTRNLRVKLDKDLLTASIDVDIWHDGTYPTGTLTSKIFVANGKPAVELMGMTMGVMPLPLALLGPVNSQVNAKLQSLNLNLPADLKEIKINQGSLTVTGTVGLKGLGLPVGALGR